MSRREVIYALSGLTIGMTITPILLRFCSRYGPNLKCPLRTLSTKTSNLKRVAVILSGCGVYDGSEIHEAVSLLVHLSRANADVSLFAPEKRQYDVIDHMTGKDMSPPARNVLVESARIARGKISNLSLLNVNDFDCLMLPGGFGVAKNLSTYGSNGQNYVVDSEVHKILLAFTEAKKPIGLCCIAPVLIAKVIPGVQLTIGQMEKQSKWPYAEDTANNLIKAGATVIAKNQDEVCIDKENKIVTAPAYMYDGKPDEIYDNIGQMVQATLKLA